MKLRDLQGLRVGVWGLGVEGKAAVRVAKRSGAAEVVVVDARASTFGGDWDVTDDTSSLYKCDVVIVSPGISRHRPDVRALAARATVTGGTAIALGELSDRGQRTLCVTGTKGKSTTSAVAATVLTGCGVSASHVGNIGKPLLGLLEPDNGVSLAEILIAEISSHQAADVDVSPMNGAITSLAPEHLDWHGTPESYYEDKLRLFANRPDAEVVVSHQALPIALQYLSPSILRTPEELVEPTVLDSFSQGSLAGRHNTSNMRVALAACTSLGVNVAACRDEAQTALQAFEALPHRLTPVASLHGILFIDDTLSTTPLSTLAALEALDTRDVTLIAGGQDRGLDFTNLAEQIASRHVPVRVVTMPDTGSRIAQAIRDASAARDREVIIRETETLAAAVEVSTRLTPKSGVVLLSPASPSFNRYTNYEQLAAAFLGFAEEAGAVVFRVSRSKVSWYANM